MEKTAGERITEKLIELHGSRIFSVAFLPYKRSMWNSMSSVYEACKASGIEAHIYPLPYYLMNSDRLVESITSDRELFQNAEDIKHLRHADYVIIHYPYDSQNAVTQMLSDYYIEKLRNIGEVVYIPYSQVHMPQLWMQRALCNIDYAFLNTEKDAAYFIEKWKQLGVDFTGRVFALGSPKLDISAEHSPEPDTVLICSSLKHFLMDPFPRMHIWERQITEKLNQGKWVTFRPHPLLYQTIKAIRPDLISVYNQFLIRIENQGASIDLSEDIEGALLKHEYLVTDPSSITGMWKQLQKPYEIM